MGFELEFLHALHGLHNPALDRIMLFITRLGDKGFIWLLICGVLILLPTMKMHRKDYNDEYDEKIKKRKKLGWSILIAEFMSTIIVHYVLKIVVGRPRPFYVDPTLMVNGSPVVYKLHPHTSFPSGHTSAAFAAAFLIIFSYKKSGIAAMSLACLIAFSRMYFGVHYPTDILGGIATGFICAKLATVFQSKWPNNYKKRK